MLRLATSNAERFGDADDQAPMRVRLHPGQSQVFTSRTRFRVAVAGRRWGKTTLARVEMLRAAATRGRVWYVAPTRVMARDIFWRDLKASMHPTWVVRAPNETNLEIELRTGALLQVLGAEDPDSLRGRGPGFVVLDEYADMAPETWTEVIRPALADTKGGALFVGTPKAYNHFHMLYAFGQGHHPDWRSWQFRTIDNPHLDPNEIEHARQTTDPRTFRQEYEASFEALAGRVYYAFDRHRHVAPVTLERVVPVAASFDFNIEPATAVIAQRVGEEVHVWREVRVSHAGGEATRACGLRVKQFLDEARWTGIVRIYGDPAGRAAKTTGPSDHAVLRGIFGPAAQWCIRPAAPHVRDRVAAVNGRLETLDGRHHLTVDPTCVGLIADLEQVVFAKNGDIDKDSNPELSHQSDALGYFVEREFPARGGLRFGAMRLEV